MICDDCPGRTSFECSKSWVQVTACEDGGGFKDYLTRKKSRENAKGGAIENVKE
jgi:hypothetical protein